MTEILTAFFLFVVLPSSRSQQISLFQEASIPAIVWSANQTFSGIGSVTACAALATSLGQCQFWLDAQHVTCEVGTSPIYQTGPGPTIDIYYSGGEWTQWSDWSPCSTTCIGYGWSGGNLTRSRDCLGPVTCPTLNSTSGCSGGIAMEFQACGNQSLPLCMSGSIVMVIGGLDGSNQATASVEVISLFQSRTCKPITNYPFPVVGAVGTYFNNQSLVCGGLAGDGTYRASCYTYDYIGNTWAASYSLQTSRYFASASQAYGSHWWVTGGYDGVSPLASTEVLTIGSGFSAGVTLPVATFRHKIVPAFGYGFGFLLFGGNDTSHQNQTWTTHNYKTGPFNQTDDVLFPTSYTGGNMYDPISDSFNYILSTSLQGSQLFDTMNNTWSILNTSLPMEGGVTNEYDNNLFALGGQIGGVSQDATFVYSYNARQWNLLDPGWRRRGGGML